MVKVVALVSEHRLELVVAESPERAGREPDLRSNDPGAVSEGPGIGGATGVRDDTYALRSIDYPRRQWDLRTIMERRVGPDDRLHEPDRTRACGKTGQRKHEQPEWWEARPELIDRRGARLGDRVVAVQRTLEGTREDCDQQRNAERGRTEERRAEEIAERSVSAHGYLPAMPRRSLARRARSSPSSAPAKCASATSPKSSTIPSTKYFAILSRSSATL